MKRSARLPINPAHSVFTACRWTVFALFVALACWNARQASALEAGYAQADITPLLGSPLAGRLERWTYTPPDDMRRAVAAVERLFAPADARSDDAAEEASGGAAAMTRTG